MQYTVKELPNSPSPYCKAYKFGRCNVLVGKEPINGTDNPLKWHLSISHHKSLPTWNELKEARYYFIPDNVTMAMILPPKSEYVNIHEYCFHLYEIDS